MAFYRLNQNGVYEEIPPVDGDIIKSEVLPGFQFRISDLFKEPSEIKMADDDVYTHFVIPEHTETKKQLKQSEKEKKQAVKEKKQAVKEKKQAVKEKKQAVKEKKQAVKRVEIAEKRAEKAEKRANRLAEKLKSLGYLDE